MMGIEPDCNDAFYQNRIYVRPPDSPVGFHAPIPTGEPIMSPGRTMLPVPQTNSVASQECVGEHAEDGQMAMNDVGAEDELARGVGAERMERAPLHYVQGRRWSPGVYLVEAPRETSTGSVGESLYRSSHFLIIISDY